MLFQFVNVLLQVLVHRSHDLLQEDIGIAVYNMASVDFDGFFTAFLPEFLSSCDGVDANQKNVLGRNFKMDRVRRGRPGGHPRGGAGCPGPAGCARWLHCSSRGSWGTRCCEWTEGHALSRGGLCRVYSLCPLPSPQPLFWPQLSAWFVSASLCPIEPTSEQGPALVSSGQ